MTLSLSTYVANRKELAQQVAMFLGQRVSSHTWILADNTITHEDIYKMMKEGDEIGYSAYKGGSLLLTKNTHAMKIALESKYHENFLEMQYVQNRLPSIVAPIMQKYKSNHARVLQLHDWVVNNFRYDTTKTSYSAYAGLANGRTVCNGYAMMFAYLCREAKIPFQIAVGDVHARGSHAWNMVQLDGLWYHIDTTWDSPVSDSPTEHIPYSYYMLTDGEMAITRKVGLQVHGRQTPTARTTYAEVLQRLCSQGDANKPELEQIRMRTGLVYTEARYTITNKQKMFDHIVSCIQRNATQDIVRYMKHPNWLSSDINWVLQRLNAKYPHIARRLHMSFQPYLRAGNVHTLVVMHFG